MKITITVELIINNSRIKLTYEEGEELYKELKKIYDKPYWISPCPSPSEPYRNSGNRPNFPLGVWCTSSEETR